VAGDQYVSELGPVQDGQQTVLTQVTSFPKPAGKYEDRGLTPAEGNSSVCIGLQAHVGKVAFRHIRIQEK
jgi:hypothetical protein